MAAENTATENEPLKTKTDPNQTDPTNSSGSVEAPGRKSKLNCALTIFAILFWGLAGYAVFLQLKVLRQANQLLSQERISENVIFNRS